MVIQVWHISLDHPGLIAHLIWRSKEVATLVATMLPLVSLAQFFDQGGAVLAGILRSRGKQVGVNLFQISFRLLSN